MIPCLLSEDDEVSVRELQLRGREAERSARMACRKMQTWLHQSQCGSAEYWGMKELPVLGLMTWWTNDDLQGVKKGRCDSRSPTWATVSARLGEVAWSHRARGGAILERLYTERSLCKQTASRRNDTTESDVSNATALDVLQ